VAVLSLNDRSRLVAETMLAKADQLGLAVHQVSGATVLDCGSRVAGSLQAGLLMARACLADLATVSLVPGEVAGAPLPRVVVDVLHPVPACMASGQRSHGARLRLARGGQSASGPADGPRLSG